MQEKVTARRGLGTFHQFWLGFWLRYRSATETTFQTNSGRETNTATELNGKEERNEEGGKLDAGWPESEEEQVGNVKLEEEVTRRSKD